MSRMPTYGWQGRDLNGTRRRGLMPAGDAVQLRRDLRSHGIFVEHAVAVPAWLEAIVTPTTPALRPRQTTPLLRQLSTMATAGIPLVEALEMIAREEKHAGLRRVIGTIRHHVVAGMPLSAALAEQPRHFSPLICGLVQAGEQSGELETLLERIASDAERSETIRRRLRRAMLYPGLVLCIALIVTLALLMFVVPRFESLFQGFGAQLPLFTRQVIAASEWLRHGGWLVMVAVIVCLGLIGVATSQFPGLLRYRDRLLLRLPLIGALIEGAMIARFTRTLAVMLRAGIPLAEALPTIARTLGNTVYRDAVSQMGDHLRDGRSLAFAVGSAGHFPASTGQMIATGEASGRLETMLQRIAERHETRVIQGVDGLGTALEPIIMSLLGLLVGGLVLAMYLPVFQLGAVV
ncbi:type II secretion system F family protein [Spiribacter insolitus]|uniref:Type II secretion system F family protein n=1 Tax=Spiribacter insolitus TaxID=3122417 RepID=A0ABV3T5S2_9GAMM